MNLTITGLPDWKEYNRNSYKLTIETDVSITTTYFEEGYCEELVDCQDVYENQVFFSANKEVVKLFKVEWDKIE